MDRNHPRRVSVAADRGPIVSYVRIASAMRPGPETYRILQDGIEERQGVRRDDHTK